MSDIVIIDSDDEVPCKKQKQNEDHVDKENNDEDDDEMESNNLNGSSIRIDVDKEKMVLTIEKDSQTLTSDSKEVTHAISDSGEAEAECSSKASSCKDDHGSDNLADLEFFLTKCQEGIKVNLRDLLQRKLKSLRILMRRATCYINTDEFNTILKQNLKEITNTPANITECFINIYNEIQTAAHFKDPETEPTEKDAKLIKLLEISLSSIHQKIRRLEVQEVDFDDENDSVYMQFQRYKERATQLYNRYCKLLKMDPHVGRITYTRLDFGKSDYTEFNKALNREYKNNKKFPTYANVDKVLRDTIAKNNMNLTEKQICAEVKKCFEELGNLMQKRRQMELHILHSSYINDNFSMRDPAENDVELRRKLEGNKTLAEQKLNKLCTLYVEKQEKGEEIVLSEDSDDSDKESSDDD